jgi:hypothetical protein
LPEGQDEALLDQHSLRYIVPMARLVVACTRPLDDLLEAFRTGREVPYARYGTDLHEGRAGFTRPMFERLPGSQWLPVVPDIGCC